MTSSLYEARNAPKQMIMNFSRRITGLKGLQRNNNAKVLVKGVFFVLSCVIGLPDSSVDVVIASQSSSRDQPSACARWDVWHLFSNA